MSAGTPSELSSVTRGGQVIVLVPVIKTEQVPATSQVASELMSSTMNQNSLTALLASSSLVSLSSSVVISQVPTTLLTTTRPQGPPVVVVTHYLTITTPASTPVETFAVWTRPGETQPAKPPFPLDGGYTTSQGPSPLETGGVHLPQPEFNGLAASPGVIAGTFGAILGVGIICLVYCMVKRKHLKKLLKEGKKTQNTGPPVLPPVPRQPDSPVWFTQETNSIELKNLPTTTATSMTAPSTSTYRGSTRYHGRQGVLDVAGTQQDPHGDILTTTVGGTTSDPKEEIQQHNSNKAPQGLFEQEQQGGRVEEHEDSIGLAFTKPEPAVERGPFPVTIEEVEDDEMREARGINVPDAPYLLSELEDTSDKERYHTFIK
ncbi:hypothetical protein AA313_de0200768 [Arthrobotrys entomopaga]|nr:hypothetical protein AA313_de0200768 [Arthrobotrys entomopaga]